MLRLPKLLRLMRTAGNDADELFGRCGGQAQSPRLSHLEAAVLMTTAVAASAALVAAATASFASTPQTGTTLEWVKIAVTIVPAAVGERAEGLPPRKA